MALLIRHDATGSVLRSVDDTPGILGCGQPWEDEPTRFGFYVSPTWSPSQEARRSIDRLQPAGLGGIAIAEVLQADDAQRLEMVGLEIDDVVPGCETVLELAVLLQVIGSMLVGCVQTFVPGYAFEAIRDAAGWAVEAREAIAGELRRRGVPT